MSKEVGSAHVAVFPTFQGLRSAIKREVDSGVQDAGKSAEKGLDAAGKRGGAALGGGLKSAFTQTAGDMNARALKQFQGEVASAARSLSVARLRQQDDAGRVTVAEARLAEAIKKSGAESSQAVAAQERLASAQRKLEESNGRVTASSESLARAQAKLKSVQDSLAGSAESAGGGMRSAFARAGALIAPVASGIHSAFDAAMAGVKRVAHDAATFAQSVFKTAGAAVAATLGVALVKGFSRLEAIDTARTKLSALGNSAGGVQTLMDAALDSVKGTAFGLGDAAGAAAALASAKVPVGQVGTALKSLAATAGVAGADMGEMGSIFAKVAAKQKLSGEIVNQLMERQVPILQMIADYYHVTGEEASEMVSKGKISFTDFVAITGQLGDAAKVMGTSFKGMVANVGAALGRFGAVALQPMFDSLKAVMPGVINVLDHLTDAIRPVFAMISARLVPAAEKLGQALSAWKFDGSGLAGIGTMLGPLLPVLGAVAGLLGGMLGRIPLIGDAFAGLSAPLGLVIGLFGSLLMFSPEQLTAGFASMIPAVTSALNSMLGAIVQFASTVIPEMLTTIVANLPVLVAGIVQLVQAIITTLASNLPAIVGALAGLLPQLVTALLRMIPTLLGAALQLIQSLVQAVVTVAPMIIAVLLQLLPKLITTILSMLPGILQAALSMLLGIVMAVVQAIPQIVTALVALLPMLIQTLVAMIPQLLSTAITLFLALINGLVQALPMIVTALISAAPQLIAALISMIPQLIIGAFQLFIGIINGLVQALPEILVALIGIGPQLVIALIAMIPQLIMGAIQLFMALVKAVPQIIPQLMTTLDSLGPKMGDQVMQIGPRLLEAGKALMHKLIDGIKSMIGALGDALGGVMDWVKGFFPHSPAKRGPLSGAGWTRIGEGGAALIQQFQSGIDRTSASVSFGTAGLSVTGAAGASIPDQITLVDSDGSLLGLMDVRINRAGSRRQVALSAGLAGVV